MESGPVDTEERPANTQPTPTCVETHSDSQRRRLTMRKSHEYDELILHVLIHTAPMV